MFFNKISILQRIPQEASRLINVPISIDLNAKNKQYFASGNLQTYCVSKETTEEDLKAFCVIDVETTGLNNVTGDIVEISAVKFYNGQPVSFFSTLINPMKKIPSIATNVNGITDSMVSKAPAFAQIKDAFQSYIDQSPIIVGHNISFDIHYLSINGIKFDENKQYFDTLYNARKTIKASDTDNYQLETLSNLLNIPLTPHNSVSDCLAAGLLLWKLAEIKRCGK